MAFYNCLCLEEIVVKTIPNMATTVLKGFYEKSFQQKCHSVFDFLTPVAQREPFLLLSRYKIFDSWKFVYPTISEDIYLVKVVVRSFRARQLSEIAQQRFLGKRFSRNLRIAKIKYLQKSSFPVTENTFLTLMINVHAEPKTHVPPPFKGITKDVE